MSQKSEPVRINRETDCCTFHVIVEGASVPLGQLLDYDAPAHIKRFRSHLYRVARLQHGGMPSGLLFAAFHGAYDPSTQTFPVHIHGIATGGKVALIDSLRTLRMYKPAVAGDGRDAAITPIMRSRAALVNMPDPVTYIMKSYWPLRPTRLDADGLRRAIPCKVQRITDEPAHSEYLQFLDKWAADKLTLIMGMHVTKSGLIAL